MELTSKCKEDFEDWIEGRTINTDTIHKVLLLNDGGWININCTEYFYQLPESMQWGVIQDFADSKGIVITIEYWPDTKEFEYRINSTINSELFELKVTKDRQQARTESIKKFNEIYNQ